MTTVTQPGAESGPQHEEHQISWRLVLVLAIACGMTVANLYYAQPLLDTIAQEFQTGPGPAGLVMMLTQIGYAVGLALIVPLGDLVERRRLVLTVLSFAVVALLIAAIAPSLIIFGAISVAIGTASVVAQILVPFAASLASDHNRGKVVGTVMTGLLMGILLARTLSGAVSAVAGWRTVYWLGAAMMLLLALVLWRELPKSKPMTGMSYPALLRSVFHLVQTEPILRRRMVYGFLVFASFSAFWTSLAFLLSRPPYSFNDGVIGLFGLFGVAGVLAASVAGRLADRGLQRWATGASLLFVVVSYGLAYLGTSMLPALILCVVILDLGVQGTQILNQSVIYSLRPDARSRLTTAYMTTFFTGGSLGSMSSAFIYSQFGWPGVSALGASLGLLAFLFWLTDRTKVKTVRAH